MPVYSQITQSRKNVRVINQLCKNWKGAWIIRRGKTYKRISKKENGLIIIVVLSVPEKKTSVIFSLINVEIPQRVIC